MADGKEVDEGIIIQEIEEDIISLLSALKSVDREIFIEHYINGVSLQDISVSMNKKTEWIYNRVSRGKKKLRKICLCKGDNCHEK